MEWDGRVEKGIEGRKTNIKAFQKVHMETYPCEAYTHTHTPENEG